MMLQIYCYNMISMIVLLILSAPTCSMSTHTEEELSFYDTQSAKKVSNATDLPVLLQNKEIRSVWPQRFINACMQRDQLAIAGLEQCFVRRLGFEHIKVEILHRKPAVLRLHRFILPQDSLLARIARRVRTSSEVESQGVEGMSNGGRRADGMWMLHQEPEARELFMRIRHVLTLNPAIAEDFLVLKYGPFGHYAPHYDHLDPMPASYDDGWFAYFGNRLATALLLVEPAVRGGSTVFPRLGLNIRPERGDLLLWMNADSNDRKEERALHAACPIVEGEKIAVSLWIRGNFQDELQRSRLHEGYEPEELIRREIARDTIGIPRVRPSIPRWVFDQ